MSGIEERAWKSYVKTRKLTLEELQSETLCDNLRESFDFANHRLWFVVGEIVDEVLIAFGIKVTK